MRIKIEGSNLVIHLCDLLRNLDLEDKRKIADTLACQGDIIKDVVNQVLTGQTESGSHSELCCTAQVDPCWPGLDWACREVARRAGESAAIEIKRLEDALKFREEQLQKLHDENRGLRQIRYEP